MSLRKKLVNKWHRWADGTYGSGAGGSSGGNLDTHGFGPGAGVQAMAEDAATEGDAPEQEREYEQWQAEQAKLGLPTDS